jgi:hypothetical protein
MTLEGQQICVEIPESTYLLWLSITTTNCGWNDMTCFCAIPINHSRLNLLKPQQNIKPPACQYRPTHVKNNPLAGE